MFAFHCFTFLLIYNNLHLPTHLYPTLSLAKVGSIVSDPWRCRALTCSNSNISHTWMWPLVWSTRQLMSTSVDQRVSVHSCAPHAFWCLLRCIWLMSVSIPMYHTRVGAHCNLSHTCKCHIQLTKPISVSTGQMFWRWHPCDALGKSMTSVWYIGVDTDMQDLLRFTPLFQTLVNVNAIVWYIFVPISLVNVNASVNVIVSHALYWLWIAFCASLTKFIG